MAKAALAETGAGRGARLSRKQGLGWLVAQSARGGGCGANARVPGRAGRRGGLLKGLGRGGGRGGWVQRGAGPEPGSPAPPPSRGPVQPMARPRAGALGEGGGPPTVPGPLPT